MEPIDLENILLLTQQDFGCFCLAMRPGFELAKHTSFLIDRLEAIERDQSLLQRVSSRAARLLLSTPPRHGKTLLLALFICWYLGRHPERSVIFATYGQDLSDDIGRLVRNLITGSLFRAIFPGCRLSPDSTSQRRFDTTAGGSFYGVGRGGPITGRGAHLLVCDDLLKDVEEARSETVRRGLHDWFGSVAFTRLMPGGAVIVVGTRWHEDDLTGWLLREHVAEGWELLNLPALAEADDLLGRAEGEALWPERYPVEALASFRKQMGGAAFAALYQQRPSAAEGSVFKRSWIRTYSQPPAPFNKIVQSWDTSFKTGSENDFSVGTTWGVTQTGYYLLSLWRARVEFPELKRQVGVQANEWKPSSILIEDKASGQSLIQELKTATRFPVLPVKVDRDKRARAEAVTPLFEAGKVYVPEGAPWLADYVDELAGFPSGRHDDMVDSTTQALNFLRVRIVGSVQVCNFFDFFAGNPQWKPLYE